MNSYAVRWQRLVEWVQRHEKFLELAGFGLGCAFLVSRWVDIFIISPDSAQYLTAAMNLVDHGTLFIWTNWPSYSYLPEREIYAIYPPGFALYLAVFYFFIRESMASAMVAQSVAIMLFCWMVREAGFRFGLSALVRLGVLLFLCVFPAYVYMFPSLLTETLFTALSLGVFIKCFDLWDRGWNRRDAWTAWILLFLVSSVRWNGLANAVFFLFPLWKFAKERGWIGAGLRLVLTGFVGIAPVILWMIRNRLMTGKNAGHYQPTFFLWDRLWTPFEHTLQRWGLGSVWFLAAVSAFSLWPLIGGRVKPWFAVAGLLGHFSVIYLLTLMFAVTPLDDRYIGSTYLFLIFLQAMALQRLADKVEAAHAKTALGLVLAAMVALLPMKIIRSFGDWNRPPHQELWQRIKSRDWFQGSTHFYTDDDWVHQVFARMPQRIVFDEVVKTAPHRIADFWNVGTRPFWITRVGTPLHGHMETVERKRLPRLQREEWNGYVVYWLTSGAAGP